MSSRWTLVPGNTVAFCFLQNWGKNTGEESFRLRGPDFAHVSPPMSNDLLAVKLELHLTGQARASQ
jgi:hypothetical protein